MVFELIYFLADGLNLAQDVRHVLIGYCKPLTGFIATVDVDGVLWSEPLELIVLVYLGLRVD